MQLTLLLMLGKLSKMNDMENYEDDLLIEEVLESESEERENENRQDISISDVHSLLVKTYDLLKKLHKSTKIQNNRENIKDSVLNMLPLKSAKELKEFNNLIKNRSLAKQGFIEIARNSTLKDIATDDLIFEMNFSGAKKKISLRDQKFFQVWKKTSGMNYAEFDRKMREELNLSHNRTHAKQSRAKKKMTREPLIEQNEDPDEDPDEDPLGYNDFTLG
ncbi:uncharacterized protein LOC129799200 [Phlebotomus papatasi]|uniref:uncharacterized protein LOC129799200 n=1 Tax=Phlebotomus papatasi TaxID=29031 RepID=UPI00248451ED|nr:uncharacterized protein LOC129799200 [Phlebotomus papatasi]